MREDFEVNGAITIDDKASRVLQNVGRSADSLSNDLEDVGKSAKESGKNMDTLTRSLSDAERKQLDNVRVAQQLKDAQNNLKDKQRDLNDTVKKYGVESDEAADKLREFNDAQKNVNSLQQQLNPNIKTATVNFKDLAVGLSGVATSAFSLYNAYDRVADMQLQVDRANLKVKTSANLVEDAQRRQTNAGIDLKNSQDKLTVIIEKYGVDSEEAARQTEIVSQKLAAYDAAAQDAQLSTEKYDLAVENAQQTQDNFTEAIVQSAIQMVPTTITLIDNVGKVANAFTSLKNYDFSALVNKFTGKGGVADAITSTGSNVDGLSGKFGGLNNIKFAGLLGALAGVAVVVASVQSSLSQLETAKSVYEAQHGTEMGTGEQVIQGVKGFFNAPADIATNFLADTFGVTKPTAEQQALINWYQAGKLSAQELKTASDTGDYASWLVTAQYRAGEITQAQYLQKLTAITRNLPQYASGFEGITTGPTMFVAGEGAERERVSIQPLSKLNKAGDSTIKAEVINNIKIGQVTGGENVHVILDALRRAVQNGTDRGLVIALNQRSSELNRRLH